MHQAFNALLQFHERAVIGHAQHAALDARADWITLGGIEPRIRRELLESQGNAQLLTIKLEDFHLNLVAHMHQITRMREASP